MFGSDRPSSQQRFGETQDFGLMSSFISAELLNINAQTLIEKIPMMPKYKSGLVLFNQYLICTLLLRLEMGAEIKAGVDNKG